MGLKTSIITNASRMAVGRQKEHALFLDQVGISCDSLDDKINQELGRGFGNHVAITERALTRIRDVNNKQGLKIKSKLISFCCVTTA